MESVHLKLSDPAKTFLRERSSKDVTFDIIRMAPVGSFCPISEIEPSYDAPNDARTFRYWEVDGFNIFISKDVKILGPMSVDVEGFWKLKWLALNGAVAPF